MSAREQIDRKPAPADKRSTSRPRVSSEPAVRSRPAELLALQRAAGNRAVQRLLNVATPGASIARRPAGGAAADGFIRRMVDRKKVEANARPIMLRWIRGGAEGERSYALVSRQYQALLDGVDAYQQYMAGQQVAAFNDGGVDTFKAGVLAEISRLRSLCMALTLADDAGDLDEPVVNYVLGSLNKEESTVTEITQTFADMIFILARRAWDGQFAEKTYERAVKVAEFALPLYKAGYMGERGFLAEGAFGREMPKKGFKLHVSVHEISMVPARNLIMPFLRARGGLHKMVADVAGLTGVQAGKVITIYPMTPAEALNDDGFDALIGQLDGLLAGSGIVAGPAVRGEVAVGTTEHVYRETNATLTEAM